MSEELPSDIIEKMAAEVEKQPLPRRVGHAVEVQSEKIGASINWRRVEEGLEAGCTGAEIASRLGVSAPVLYKLTKMRYGLLWTDYAERFTQAGEFDIKVTRHSVAVKDRNVDMLKYLSKWRLGEKDEPQSLTSYNILVQRKSPEQSAIELKPEANEEAT